MRSPSPLFGLLLPLGGFGLRTLALAIFVFVCGSVAAQSQSIMWRVPATQGNGPFDATTADAACVAAGPFYTGSNPLYTYRAAAPTGTLPNQSALCQYSGGGNYVYMGATAQTFCPSGSTWHAGTQTCQGANPCFDKTGDTESQRFTVGYARSSNPNAPDYVPPFTNPANTTVCKDGCAAQVGAAPTDAWRSQIPASNGLHRVSVTIPMTYSGQQCSGADSPSLDPDTPVPPCPGLIGTVNGQPVCIGTESSPLPQTPRAGPMPPEGFGNPAAGGVPTSGPGSGTGAAATPAVGNGGPAGGGSNAAIPGGGSEGNGQGSGTPLPLNPDGTPDTSGGSTGGSSGEPTPIDEAGMPSGSGAYDAAKAAVDANRDAAVAAINTAAGAAGKNTGWTFSFALPTGCNDIPLAAFAPYLSGINVCTWQPMIHDLMSLVWLAATVFCCIGMVGRAVGGGGT